MTRRIGQMRDRYSRESIVYKVRLVRNEGRGRNVRGLICSTTIDGNVRVRREAERYRYRWVVDDASPVTKLPRLG
jgi:hypothetical protein